MHKSTVMYSHTKGQSPRQEDTKMKTIWTGEFYRVRRHRDRKGNISYQVEFNMNAGSAYGPAWSMLSIKGDEETALRQAQNHEGMKQAQKRAIAQ